MMSVFGVRRFAALSIGLFSAAGAWAQAPVMVRPQASAPAMAQEQQPPFMEKMGRFAAGEAIPNFAVQGADGKPAKLYDFIGGKTTIIGLWNGEVGPGEELLQWLQRLATDYRAQDVTALGIASESPRENLEKWAAANRGKYSFPVVWDPAGAIPPTGKPYDDLTPQERARYQQLLGQHISATIQGRLVRTGGMVLSLPVLLVVDKEGRMVGWTSTGERGVEGIGNLLSRAEVKLNAKDQPKKLWSREETRPEPTVAEGPSKMLAAGADAPDFTALDLGGKPVKLSDYRGKVVVLDFWATWCGPCLASMPETNEVAKKYKDQGVVVLAVCTADPRASFDKWMPANQGKYSEIHFSHDPLERKPERIAAKLYGVPGLPTQFVIGRDGKVAAALVGYGKGESILEGSLAKAGVKVDPAIVAKAEEAAKNIKVMPMSSKPAMRTGGPAEESGQ